MFDLTSSKLLILGVVALIVVGPKELPFLLRTIGKYVAMMRRQANEFRSQFDEAMREAELDDIRKDVEKVARDAEVSLRDAGSSVDREIHASQQAVDESMKSEPALPEVAKAAEPMHTFDALNGLDTGTEATHAATPHVEPAAAANAPITIPIAAPFEPAPALAKTGT